MASSRENEETHAALSTTRIHIADLNSTTASEGRHIEADVVVVYPYSSKTTELSLRLVERDVLLRKAKGQVKATFHDAVARKVAESRPGIGDTICLSLQDVELVEEYDEVATPGKKAGFTLHFYHAVQLQLSSDHGLTQLVDYVASTTPPISPDQLVSLARNGAAIAFETPASGRIFNISGTPTVSGSISLLRNSQRISSNPFPDSIVDPFLQEDGHIEGRGRKRAKFARHSGAWRFTDSDEEGTDTSNLHEDSGIDTDSTSANPVREIECVVDSNEEALLAQNAIAEPITAESVDIEDLRVLKHNAAEYGTASSINDPLSVGYKAFEQLSSSRSQTSVQSESSSSSTDQIVSVERMTLSLDDGTSIAPPGLEAEGSPHLSDVSDFMSGNQYLSPSLDHTSVLDASAHLVEPTTTFFQAPDLQVSDAIPLEDSEASERASDHEVNQIVQDDNVRLAIPPRDALAKDIDLDALQQQIEIENGTDSLVEVVDEVIEDEDMYGMAVAPQSRLKVGSEEYKISSQQMDVPTANFDDPIFVDDDDNNGEEREGIYENENDEMEEVGNPYEGKEDEDQNHLRVDLNDHVLSQSTNSDTDEAEEEVVEENNNADEERDTVTESFSPLDSSPMSARSNMMLAKSNQNDDGPEPQQLHLKPKDSETAEQSEDVLAADDMDQLTSTKASAAPMQLSPFPDGVSDEVQSVARPLPPADMVDTKLIPVTIAQTSEATDGTDTRTELVAKEITLDSASYHDGIKKRETVTHELPTPKATQSSEAYQGDQVEMQTNLGHEIPPTPHDSQGPPPEETDRPSVVSGGLLPPLPQVDGTSARRASRRLLEKPRMSDDIYSDYFTPRKSAVRPKYPAPVERLEDPENQTVLRSPCPVSKGFGDSDGGVQKQPLGPSAKMRQPNAADDVPWASSRGMATDLGYYVYLNYLGDYYDQIVDILAVCTANSTAAERAKSGRKDFSTTIHLADSSASVGSNITTTAQVFRPHKHAIPIVKRGDVILLRKFKVQTQLHKPFLLSADESAWAVFSSTGQDATVAGPPVEFGDMETEFVSWLLDWWTGHGKDEYLDLPIQTQPDAANDKSATKKPVPQPLDLRRSPRRIRSDRATEGTGMRPEQNRSPSFNLQSPTFSAGIKGTSSPARSASAVSPSSPTSVRMTRSTGSASISVFESKELDQPAAVSPSLVSPSSKTKRGENRQAQIPSESAPHDSDEHDTLSRNPVEDNGAVMSEAETSASSKWGHRHERRSTSVVHELRDGTQYIDIDDFEVVSVSEEGTEFDEHEDAAQNSLTSEQPDLVAEDVSPQPVVAETPSKRGRGRPRKVIQLSQSHEQGIEPTVSDSPSRLRLGRHQTVTSNEPSQPDTTAVEPEGRLRSSHNQGAAAAAGTKRITRSKTAKEHNIHELRDGTVYED